MLQRIGLREIGAMLKSASGELIANESRLTELDSVGGDGDHGTTMCRVARSIQEIPEELPPNVSALFAQTGNLFLSSDGGASGGLLGAFFMSVAEGCENKPDLDSRDLAIAFDRGLAALQRYSRAKVGDKTLIDALEPACVSLRESGRRSEPVDRALCLAAQAAVDGASGTKNMKARYGRAQYLGERTLGRQDPGATTIACIFQGFVSGIHSLQRQEK